MKITRRHALGALGMSAAAVAAAGCSKGNGGAGGGGGGDDTTIRLGWWGNDLRDAQTAEAAELYAEQNEGVHIELETGAFGAYWDRLATQVAGGDAPDMLQFGDGFLAEYGDRGALLDLDGMVDTSKFSPGAVDGGRIDGKLYGINAGTNVPTVMCNLAVLERAGLEVPDDTTWTWGSFRDLAAEISATASAEATGSTSIFTEGSLRAWVRQHDEELFTTDGELGASLDTLVGYFELMVDYQESGAIPGASVIVEETGKSLEEASLTTGAAAFDLRWSNQLSAVRSSSDDEIVMLRMPTMTGRPEDLRAWYHPSMLWSVNANAKDPEAVAALVSWWVNSVDCANICLDERGFPNNTEVVEAIEPKLSEAGKAVSKFLTDLEPVLGDPQPVPPTGSGDVLNEILTRAMDDTFFARTTPADAAKRFREQSVEALAK